MLFLSTGFQRNMSLVIVLVGYGSNNNRLRVYERVDWLFFHSDLKHLPQRVLLAIHHFLSLSDRESAIVSTVISVHTSEKQEEIKTVSFLTRLPHSLVP